MKSLKFTLIALFFSLAASAQISPITGNLNICVSGATTLSDATGGGTWSSGSPLVGSAGSASGVITGISLGVTTITYTVGASYVTATVTVNAIPAGISGPSGPCIGGTVTLTDPAPGGVWASSTPTVATVGSTSGIVSGVAAGTAFITYSLGAGCVVTRMVTVSPGPALYPVVGGGNFCAGGTGVHIGLSSSSPGNNYTLYNGASPVITIAGTGAGVDFGSYPTPGTYTVTAINTISGCSSTMPGTATVAVSPLPTVYTVVGGGSYCIGGGGVSVGLNSSDAASNYQLYRGSLPIVSVIAGTGLGIDFGFQTVAGTYSVIATDPTTGCSTTMAGTATVTITGGTCSGTPTAGTAVASSTFVCSGASDFLNSSGLSTCGLNFQWQSSTDFVIWTNIAGATSPSYNSVPSGRIYYRYSVTCPSSGLSANSTPAFVDAHISIASHSVIASLDTACTATHFYISACTSSIPLNVTTWFGDGQSTNTALTTTGVSQADIYHTYDLPGWYTVKQVLYNGVTPTDSVIFPFEHLHCSSLPIRVYYDANNNGIYDSSDFPMAAPVLVEIDSNGTMVDTVSVTSGFYYQAHGLPGTVYAFKMLPQYGIAVSTPLSGVIYDTIQPFVDNYGVKYFGLNCGSSSTFDLSTSVANMTGRHSYRGDIYVHNSACTPVSGTLTVNFSQKYNFLGASPAPTTVIGNTATWNLGAVSSSLPVPHIYFWCEVPGPWGLHWLIPGDTVRSTFIINPITGDGDTTNNIRITNDTVKSSFDPNEMAVSPLGYVLPCSKLQYTIRFENTGNDTAQNITVMDTLSDYVDPRSLAIVMASAQMNLSISQSGGHNIAKFDFPNIKLLDSTHYGLCEGTVVFNIKVRPGLADGAIISNHAGIFFDDNPAVLTNIVSNITGVTPTTGQAAVCIGATDTLSNITSGGVWSTSNLHASVVAVQGGCIVTGVSAGTDTVKYTVSSSCTSRTVSKVITINPLPAAITGTPAVCAGATRTLSDGSTGGTWSNNNPAISLVNPVSGVVTAFAAGTDTVSYTLSTGCAASRSITVNAVPVPYAVTGGGSYCAGDTGVHVLLSGSDAGNNYQIYLGGILTGTPLAGIGAAIDFGLRTLAGTYTVIATNTVNACSSNMSSSAVISINPLPAVYLVSGGGAYCAGDTGVHVGLNGSNSSISYQLYNGASLAGTVTGTGGTLDFGLQTAPGTYSVKARNTLTTCPNNMAGSASITINPLPATYTVTGGGAYCAGGTGVHVNLSGSGSGVSYQLYNGGLSIGAPLAGTGGPLDFGLLTAAGTYTVVGRNPLTACRQSMISAAVVTVNPLPAAFAVSGGGSFCAGSAGGHIALSGSETGVNYQVFNGGTGTGGIIAGTGSSMDLGLFTAAGTYTVQAGNAATGCTKNMSDSAVINIIPTVTPLVSIASATGDTLCQGSAASFAAAAVNGGLSPLYQWNVNGVPSSSGNTFSYLPANNDVVSVKITSSAVCPQPDTAVASVTMTVMPNTSPVISIGAYPGTTIVAGQTDSLYAAVSNCSGTPTYQWSINSTLVPGATSAAFVSNILYSNDSISCIVACNGECGQPGTKSVRILVLAGIHSLPGEETIGLFPNPNKGTFTIRGTLGSQYAVGAQQVSVEITNLVGQVVYSRQATLQNGTLNEQLELGQLLAKGVYLLNLHSGGGNKVFRLVVE